MRRPIPLVISGTLMTMSNVVGRGSVKQRQQGEKRVSTSANL